MAKQITQIVIKNENDYINKDFASGKIIKHLGIYALPGTEFLINNKSIMMNGFGVFELDGNEFPISSIKIEKTIKNIGEHFIIIDLVYEEGE